MSTTTSNDTVILNAITSQDGDKYWNVKKKIGTAWRDVANNIPVTPGQGKEFVDSLILENKEWGGAGQYTINLIDAISDKTLHSFKMTVEASKRAELGIPEQRTNPASSFNKMNEVVTNMSEQIREIGEIKKMGLLTKAWNEMDGNKGEKQNTPNNDTTVQVLMSQINDLRQQMRETENKKELADLAEQHEKKFAQLQESIEQLAQQEPVYQQEQPSSENSMMGMFMMMQKMEQDRQANQERLRHEEKLEQERLRQEEKRWREEMELRRKDSEERLALEKMKLEEARRAREEEDRREMLAAMKEKKPASNFDMDKVIALITNPAVTALFDRFTKKEESIVDKMMPAIVQSIIDTTTSSSQKMMELSLQQMGSTIPNPAIEKIQSWVGVVKQLTPEIFGIFDKLKEIEAIKRNPAQAISALERAAQPTPVAQIPQQPDYQVVTHNPYSSQPAAPEQVDYLAELPNFSALSETEKTSLRAMVKSVEEGDPNTFMTQLKAVPDYIRQMKESGIADALLANQHTHTNVRALMSMVKEYVL